MCGSSVWGVLQEPTTQAQTGGVKSLPCLMLLPSLLDYPQKMVWTELLKHACLLTGIFYIHTKILSANAKPTVSCTLATGSE